MTFRTRLPLIPIFNPLLVLIIISVLAIKCQSSKQDYIIRKPKKDSVIVINGKAINLMEGAGILTPDKDIYWLEKTGHWEDSLYNKDYKVTGVLYTIKWKKIKVKKGEIYPQRMQGIQKIIKRPLIERQKDINQSNKNSNL